MVQIQSKNFEFLKFPNIPSKLKGKKLNNSSKKLKVSANPLGLLAENRSKKKPDINTSQKKTDSFSPRMDIITKILQKNLSFAQFLGEEAKFREHGFSIK